MMSSGGLTLPELNYMLVGEKLNQGASLYEGLWDNIAPLSALVYTSIDFLFGRSQLAYQIVALVLVFFQSLVFNKLMLDRKAFNENTYIPGLMYAVLMSFFFDLFTLTPVLMGMTFLLLALNNIFNHIEFRAKEDEKILNIGIYIGLASLFYLPYFIFGVVVLLIFMILTGTVARRYLLMLFGLFLPLLLTGCYFLLRSRLNVFIYNFLNPLWQYQAKHYMSLWQIAIVYAVPIGLLIFSLARLSQRARFNNYQSRVTQAMFMLLIFSIIFVLISGQLTPNIFIIFMPSIAFFLTHGFLVFNRRWIAEIVFTAFLICAVLVGLGTYFDFSFTARYIDETEYLVDNQVSKGESKKVLILDDDIRPYASAHAATPFLNWQLAEGLFRNPEFYDNLTIIHQGFQEDLPDVIIDTHDVMPPILERLPQMKLKYRKEGNTYYLKG